MLNMKKGIKLFKWVLINNKILSNSSKFLYPTLVAINSIMTNSNIEVEMTLINASLNFMNEKKKLKDLEKNYIPIILINLRNK